MDDAMTQKSMITAGEANGWASAPMIFIAPVI
jgi:hypothetical protein